MQRRIRWIEQRKTFLDRARLLMEGLSRRDQALRGFEHWVSRVPEQGMAVPGAPPPPPEFASRLTHLEGRSFLIIYCFDDQRVVLLDIREVPSGPF